MLLAYSCHDYFKFVLTNTPRSICQKMLADIYPDKPYGKRLLTVVLDTRAEDEPAEVCHIISKTQDPEDGFRDVTVKALADAVNRAAWWLKETLGLGQGGSYFAYLGPTDLRYPMMNLGACKAGWKTLLLSSRNSDEAQHALLKASGAKCFVCAKQERKKIDALIDTWSDKPDGFAVHTIPEQSIFLDSDEAVRPFEYDSDWERRKHDTMLSIHTSGTTGIPKLLEIPNSYFASEDLMHTLPKIDGRGSAYIDLSQRGSRILQPLPGFHIAGVLGQMVKPITSHSKIALCPPYASLTPDVLRLTIKHSKCDAAGLPPALLQAWTQTEEGTGTIRSLDYIMFGSGPLSQEAGDHCARLTPNFFNIYGSSESGVPIAVTLEDPKRDWIYMQFHPWVGAAFESIGSENLHELVIKRHSSESGITFPQPALEVFRDQHEFRTKDLFSEHPTKPGLWKYEGRRDDVIVFSTGEKVNPVTAEGMIVGSHPDITACLIVGQSRFQPGVIIELNRDFLSREDHQKTLDAIWLKIKDINRVLPGHAKLAKALVMFAHPGKPLVKTPKLSVMRRRSVDAFAREIDELFAAAESALDASPSLVRLSPNATLGQIKNAIRELLREATDIDVDWGDEDDLFAHGLDSQGVLRLGRAFNSTIKASLDSEDFERLQSRAIYQNNSIERLALVLRGALNKDIPDATSDPVKEAETLFSKYLARLSPAKLTHSDRSEGSVNSRCRKTVILTGSTGSLGQYLLRDLLKQDDVAKVYCINRTTDAQRRSDTSASSLQHAVEGGKVEFLHSADLSSSQLGLSNEDYDRLRNETTHIIHNAWPVNFNLPVSSFEGHIAGACNLVQLCSEAPHSIRLLFVSSVSSASSRNPRQAVPEELLYDFSLSSPVGYGKSKQVTELLFGEASKRGYDTCSLRVGQIAGPSGADSANADAVVYAIDGTGKGKGQSRWNTKEWFPSLVLSSAALNAVPSSLGGMSDLDWIPIDQVSLILLEILGSEKMQPILNIVNPQMSSYAQDLRPTIISNLGSRANSHSRVSNSGNETTDGHIGEVTLQDWTQRVSSSSLSASDNPAIKLLDFFSGLAASSDTSAPRYSTAKAALISSRLEKLHKLDAGMMHRWMRGWGLA